jgi:mRNA-degrading endonuclease YafQ of YafQ-DinJ toxin-antitoxin module
VALVIDPEDRNWASSVIPQLLDLMKGKLSAVPESEFTELPLEYFKGFDEDVDKIVKPAEKTIEQKKKVIPILLKDIDKLKVSMEESRILNLIDGERSVAEIADLLKMLYFKVMMTCLDLKKRDIIDTKEVF